MSGLRDACRQARALAEETNLHLQGDPDDAALMVLAEEAANTASYWQSTAEWANAMLDERANGAA